jgi:short-subunit dehydrogenase
MNQLKTNPITEQTILITGASSGIGLATARLAAKRGARVVLLSRNKEELEEVASEILADGGRALAVQADVTQKADLEKACDQAVAHFGSLHTWVNNAGGSIYGPLLQVPEEEERRLFEVNFWGVRHGCHVAYRALKASGGVIINIGSEVSSRSIPWQGMYAASKHAVKAYTDALRMELEHDGVPIGVSLIRPTAIDTPFTQHAVNHLEQGEPSLPDPAYHPQYVAEAILKCAVAPERDVFVGGPSKLNSILEALAPRLLDYFYESKGLELQSRGTAIPHTAENEGLFHAPREEGLERGGHLGKVVGEKKKAS